MNKKLNKRLKIIMSVVLFFIGVTLGVLAMWQFLAIHPEKVSAPLKYVFYMASGALVGLLLFFNTKPILYLFYLVSDALKKAFGRTKPLDIAGMLLGVSVGLMITYLADALIGLVLKIWSIRVIIDIIIGLVASFVSILLCTKFLNSQEEETCGRSFGGYLLTSSALKNIKIVPLCSAWLNGSIFALSVTVNKLIGEIEKEGSLALQNYRELSNAGLIEIINVSGEDETAQIIATADARGLKIIAESAVEYESLTIISPVLGLDTL